MASTGASQHKRVSNCFVRLRGNKTVLAPAASNHVVQRDANAPERDEGEVLGDAPIPSQTTRRVEIWVYPRSADRPMRH